MVVRQITIQFINESSMGSGSHLCVSNLLASQDKQRFTMGWENVDGW